MVMLAEHYDFVIGGNPDRDTIDLAILDVGHRGHPWTEANSESEERPDRCCSRRPDSAGTHRASCTA
jgi:hypothetical protein